MESTRGEEQAAWTASDTVVVRGCQVETTPVRSVLRAFDKPKVAWASPTTTIVASGAAATITTTGGDRFEHVRKESIALFDKVRTGDALPSGARPRLFGGFAFTDDHGDPDADSPWHGYPGAQFVLPAIQLAVTSDGAWLTAAAVGPNAEARTEKRLQHWRDRIHALPELSSASSPGIASRQYVPSREEWRDQIATTTERIDRGDLRKVVLAQSLSVGLRDTPVVTDILARLGESYPSCYRFLFEPATGNAFFGATPENLVRLRGRTIDTEALAGSTGRGETADEDEWLSTRLRESEKNNHEHDIVVEAIRDQLDGLATDIRTGTRTVRKLANVQHLQTPIRATLVEVEHVLSLVEALHPTPAVGGLPPDAALRTIRDTEAFDRGWYAAPVGWIDANGDGTFAVAIRSGVTNDRSATLFAGAGIVPDSDPDEEWDELQLKYRPILDELS